MVGTLIGGLIGAGAGALESREQRKAQEATRPKRRRLYQLQEGLNALAQQRMAGLSMLSQAAADWASALRY